MTTATVHSELVPFLPWPEFYAMIMEEWRQSEHVAMIGPTGQGKTNLAALLLPLRQFRVILGTKPVDENLDRFVTEFNYKRYETWPMGRKDDAEKFPRRLIWPQARSIKAGDHQAAVLGHALEVIYLQGGWCVYVDELWVLCQLLGLTKYIKTYLLQARSLKISLMVATQRPAWVPLEVYDQSTHLFFWGDNDDTNLNRVAGIGSLDRRIIVEVIRDLDPDRHEVLYMNTRARKMFRTIPPEVVTRKEVTTK